MGGRAKGVPNVVTRSVRASIIEGLAQAGGGGPEGVVNYVRKVATENSSLGVALLSLVCPRQAHVEVTRNEQVLLTIEDLDNSLRRAGLPVTAEAFRLDFRGDPAEDATEAEILEPAPEK